MKYFILSFISLVFCSETLDYKVKYNNIKAGNAQFSEKTFIVDSIDFKQISFSVKSNKFVDFFYKLRTEVSMIVDFNKYYIYDLTKNIIEGKKIENSYSVINYNSKIISYGDEKIMFDGDQVYSILSLIYFLRTQDLELHREYFVNIYNNGNIKPVIAKVTEKKSDKNNIIYFTISVKSDDNKNHMSLIISDFENKKIPVQFELYTKNGTMELTIEN